MRLRHLRRSVVALLLLPAAVLIAVPAAAAATPSRPHVVTRSADTPLVEPRWQWPITGAVARDYAQPPHPYAAGHRGVDVAAEDSIVGAPDDGVVIFRGTVVDRALLTIDHGGGIVSTLEPVDSDLVPGTLVRQGDPVGRLATGGHAEPGALHLGARWHGEYVNPLLFLGGIPRAVLLPCC